LEQDTPLKNIHRTQFPALRFSIMAKFMGRMSPFSMQTSFDLKPIRNCCD